MFGSIYIGLSGLTAYSKGLQTVSNNVSNMNTIGYKASSVSFSDLFGQSSKGGLDYSTAYDGGGHGVSVNAKSINFGQGEIRQTDRDLDLAIDGNGFFVLLDGDQTYYARTGSFEIDDKGYVVLQGTDFRLAVLGADGRPVAINIDASRTDPPVLTDRIKFADNLSSTATTYDLPDLKVYDARGTEHRWSVKFTRPETVFDTWSVKVTDAAGKVIGTKELKFSGGGIDPTTKELLFEDADAGLSVTFDFSQNVTSFSTGTVSSLRAADIAGHATGSIATVKINEKGEIELTYTNEEKKQVGAVALADFREPQALEQRSKSLFVYTGFGQRQLLTAEDSRVGTIKGQRLEASNVDLGAQFGDLILIQRGFQASSQIISVTNDMIQQLFGIRGQGMTVGTPWLPTSALRSERAAAPFARAVGEWSKAWFGIDGWSAARTFGHGAADGWQALREGELFGLLARPRAMLDLAFALLAIRPRTDLTDTDSRLLRRLAAAALDDLQQRLEAILPASLAASTGRGPRWRLAVGPATGPALMLDIAEAALVAVTRTTFRPAARRDPLAPRHEAMGDVKVDCAVHLGRAALAVQQIAALECGDIIVLDQDAHQPVALALAGKPSPLRFAIGADGNRTTLTFQD